MDANFLEAVEQASLLVFCYHARIIDVTLVDVIHIVDQVSGAADQDREDLLVMEEKMIVKKVDGLGKRHLINTNIMP